MKLLRKVVSLILVFILGFWMAFAGILDGTKAGNTLETVVGYLPNRSDIDNMWDRSKIDEPQQVDLDSEEQNNSFSSKVASNSKNNEINTDLIEKKIIDLTNVLRQEQGLSTLQPNDALRVGANVRARELEESFSHTRPDGSDAFTVFQTEGLFYPYKMVGENLAMGTYYLSEEEMAQLLFEGWVESEGHYENMVRQEYVEIGVGVHYDGEFLYLTQLFGTQQ